MLRLLVPGIFLLLLGVGNLSVGVFKGQEYQSVLDELSSIQPSPGMENTSPLRRIRLAKKAADRRYERLDKARARRDFYHLVLFGGKVFVGISVILLFAGGGLHYFQSNRFPNSGGGGPDFA